MPTKLTAAHVARLEPRDKQFEVTDAGVPGLVFRVQPSGAKRWGFRYRDRSGGGLRYLVLGGYPELSLEGARQRARARRQDVVDGENPATERDRRREKPTLGDLWAAHREGYALPNKRPKTAADELRRWKRHVEPWAGRKAGQVSDEDAVGLIRRVGRKSGPYEANRLLSLLRHLYRWAADEKLLSCANPFADIAPDPREEARERELSPGETERLLASIAAQSDPVWRGYFLLLLLTGCRRTELLTARWDWLRLDTDPPLLSIPRESTKQKRPHRLPLSTAVVETIAALPSRGRSPWLFPNSSQGGPRTEPKHAWAAILERAGISGLRVHDLRHAVGSSLGNAGENAFIVAKALGHSRLATTERYVHPELGATHLALEAHARRILEPVKSVGSELRSPSSVRRARARVAAR